MSQPATTNTPTTGLETETGTAASEAEPGTGAPADTAEPAADDALAQARAEAEKWKALARKHEGNAKTNAAKAKQLDAIEDANKTETQKLTEAREAAETAAAEAQAELARHQAALKHGLSEDDLALLGTGTPEEIADRAARLAQRLKGAEADKAKRTDFGGGHRGSDVGGKGQWTRADLAGKTPAQIEAARLAGHLDQLMGKTS
jgi:hypothetical protein